MPTNPSFLRTALLVLTAWSGAFLVALWLSLIFWTYRDIRNRGSDPLLRILAVLLVAVLFLPGLVIYLILRPPYTLEEEYQRTLEEEALLQAVEEAARCPGCGRRVQPDWLICPYCHTRLKKACHNCGKLMELPWEICPYCGTPAPGVRQEKASLDDALTPLLVGQPEAEAPPDEETSSPE
jgi:Predicted nucleic acid-binding protein, consists of a PIN domain and a Zn-ribbon module